MAIDAAANLFMDFAALRDYGTAGQVVTEEPNFRIVDDMAGNTANDSDSIPGTEEIITTSEKRPSRKATVLVATLLFVVGSLWLNPGARSKSLDCSRYEQDPAWRAYGEVLKQNQQVGLNLMQTDGFTQSETHIIVNCAFR